MVEKDVEALQEQKVSVIISTRNEENTVRDVIVGARPYAMEIIVVDGHSRDKTRAIAEELGAKVVLDRGKGKGDAVRMGIGSATGDIIAFIDADGSHDPRDIPKLTALIKEGRADLVIGSRMRGGSDELFGKVEYLFRLFGQAIITTSINLYYRTELTDSQNGLRAIRADVAREIRLGENIATIEQEMLLKTLKRGYRVAEVPCHEYSRKFGASTITLRRVWLRWIYVWLRYLFFK